LLVAGSDHDEPARLRGAVRPPPSSSPEDAPDSVDVPRMEPPPPSLEAMVQSAPASSSAKSRPMWPLLVLVLLVAAITFFVMR